MLSALVGVNVGASRMHRYVLTGESETIYDFQSKRKGKKMEAAGEPCLSMKNVCLALTYGASSGKHRFIICPPLLSHSLDDGRGCRR